MYSLASHLEKLSWEKDQKLRKRDEPAITTGTNQCPSQTKAIRTVCAGKYLVPLSSLEGETVSGNCLDTSCGEQLSCRVYDSRVFQSKADLFFAGTQGVHPIKDVFITGARAFVFSDLTYGDLHQYLRDKKKLTEVQAVPLFRQIVGLIRDAHSAKIALRDIKLKKFVFEDPNRNTLSLHYLDDAQLMDESGLLADRHGCPAYVSPEMLQPGSYSGQAADLWSLGVILYTLLVGHYPFFDSSPQNLFSKVRSGYYQVPDHVSELARSLISSLLAYEPGKRIPAWAVLEHPWFKYASDENFTTVLTSYLNLKDQTVPN